jgi:imidazolonepropionase-like amidohydrolase
VRTSLGSASYKTWRSIGLIGLATTSLLTPGIGISAEAATAEGGPKTTAFVNVAVAPMDRDRILTNQTVVVTGDRITAMGANETTKIPDGALRIQADNQYFLIPGLADMHVHLRYETDLSLLIANGVTLVRNMKGSPFHLKLRGEVASGARIGPRIVTCGAQLRGENTNARTPEEARALVAEQAAQGYDFIKVYDGLTKEAYAAIVSEAARRHLPVAGHVPTAVGVEGALAARQASIEHAEQYVYHYFGDFASFDLDRAKIPIIASRTAAAGTFVTPTLGYIGDYVLEVENRDEVFRRAEMRFVEPETYAWWKTSERSSASLNRIINSFQKDLVKGFRDAGVKMLAGTDFYIFGSVPGFSLHRELHALVEAGLTPFQALSTATRNPAEFFQTTDTTGTVGVGKAADLVLVSGNPLDDIDNTRRIVGVMAKGNWMSRDDLDKMLNSMAGEFDREHRLVDDVLSHGPAGTIAEYHRSVRPGSKPYFSESTMNLLGYYFLGHKRFDEAISLFTLVTEAYPRSAEAFDSLGDAYAAAGRTSDALESYERSVKLDPAREDTKTKMKKIQR